MLYQNTLTGMLHEVPDGQVYESDVAEYPYGVGEVVDGLGNPVGALPFLAPFIPKIASLASSLIPTIGGLFGGRAPAPPLPIPPPPMFPGAPPPGMPFRPPWPLGWVRPQLPYTGLGPRRLYMRCAVWPGPRGLVPAMAAQAPVVPAQAAAAAAAQTAMQMAAGGRRRRRRR